MQAKGDQQTQEVVEVRIVVRVGDALGLNHQQTLERVDDLLNLLPTLTIFLNTLHITPDYFIHAFVLFDKNKQKVMGCLTHLCLSLIMPTLSSESSWTTCENS